jgi:hypothetical protein
MRLKRRKSKRKLKKRRLRFKFNTDEEIKEKWVTQRDPEAKHGRLAMNWSFKIFHTDCMKNQNGEVVSGHPTLMKRSVWILRMCEVEPREDPDHPGILIPQFKVYDLRLMMMKIRRRRTGFKSRFLTWSWNTKFRNNGRRKAYTRDL